MPTSPRTRSLFTPPKSRGKVFSIGHGRHALATFLRKLKKNKVRVLIDVRTYPMSRWSPHFSRKPLAQALEKDGIQYLWYGDRLGGRGENSDYRGAIQEVAAMVQDGTRACLMCSESDPAKCHRSLTLEPSLAAQGVSMQHIVYEKGEV